MIPPIERKVLVTAGIMLSLFVAALDQTIVGTAMPRIVAELQGLDRYAWVTTAYLVTSTVTTPIAGKLGDLFGRKPFLLVGILGFMAGSWLCGFSQDMNQLIFFRGLQGVFGGILFASVFSVVADIFPPAQRAKIQGVFGAVFGLAAIVGPTAGGFLTDNWGWRWVFYVNIPVGIMAVVLVASFLPYVRSKRSWRDVDYWGALAMAAGLSPILVGLTITRDHAWNSFPVLGLIALGLFFLAIFFVIEHYEKEPIVPLALFRNRAYSVAVIVTTLSAFGMFGSLIFVPLVFQGVLGQSATNSGTLITPMMLGLVVGSVICGQLMVRIRRYQFLGTLGMAIIALGFYFLSEVSLHSTSVQVTASLIILGFGMGITFPLYINAVQSAVDQKYIGVVSSNVQFFRNIGGTIATAILGSILASRLPINIQSQINALNLPPSTLALLNKSGSVGAQNLFDPSTLSAQRAAIPASVQPLFDSVELAIKSALASTLHELFIIGLVAILLGLVATVFMPTVHLRKHHHPVVPAPES